MGRQKHHLWAAALLCAECTLPTRAGAQDRQPDILVTAGRNGATGISETPVAVTVVTGAAIDIDGSGDLRDLTLPNLAIAQTGPFAQIYLRGIGSGNVFGGSDPSVAMIVDGVYLARPAAYLTDFLDVARVEVLRGPQSTLYGRNTIGGTISVISRAPNATPQASMRIGMGTYATRQAAGRISGPIASGMSASLAVQGRWHGAYLNNIVPGVGDVDDERSLGVRGQFRAEPAAGVVATLRLDHNRADDAEAGNTKALERTADPLANSVLGDLRHVALNLRTRSIRRSSGVALDTEADLTDARIRSITAWRSSHIDYSSDSDAIALDLRRTHQGEDQQQFSQELLATGNRGPIDWIAGALYFEERIQVDARLDRVGIDQTSYRPLVRTRAASFHASATLAAGAGVSLGAGLRYNDEIKRFEQDAQVVTVPGGAARAGDPVRYERRAHDRSWSPHLSAEYRPAPDVLLYSALAHGSKSGGFNFASEDRNQGFMPERLWSIEAGLKARLARGAADLRTAAFAYDLRDMQVLSASAPGVSMIGNAARARIKGIEAEIDLRATPWLRLGASLAGLDARYRRYPTAPVAGGTIDAAGKRLGFAPEFSGSGHAQFQMGRMSTRIAASYRSRQFFTPANQAPADQPGYALVDAWAAYTLPGDRLRLSGFARNLGDVAFVTSTAGYGSGISARIGPPRRLGVQLEAGF